MNRLVYIFIVLLLPAIKAAATVKLHSLFSDNMVIQRELPIHIFGTADQGESITVTFGNATVHAVADIKGNWSVELPAQEVCMIGQSLVVEGKTKIVLRDILIGDVWLCSGQSNMEMALGSCNDSVAIKEADYSTIRFVRIPYLCKDSPQTDRKISMEYLYAVLGRRMFCRRFLFCPKSLKRNGSTYWNSYIKHWRHKY